MPYFKSTGGFASTPSLSMSDVAEVDRRSRRAWSSGMTTSLTSELTILPKAVPMITPTAKSTTLPFTANSRNSDDPHRRLLDCRASLPRLRSLPVSGFARLRAAVASCSAQRATSLWGSVRGSSARAERSAPGRLAVLAVFLRTRAHQCLKLARSSGSDALADRGPRERLNAAPRSSIW